MDKVFLGLDCASLDKGIESEAITKVEILNNDGEIVGQAGTATGKTLTVTNPDGNNTMASYILSQVSGYVQRGYNASRAIIDPAAELGDGVTVGGIYSVIASENINYDALYTSDISAPDADEVDDEYPYQTYQQRVERKVAGAWSAITKTNNSISLIVDSTTGNVTAAKIVESINDAGSEVKISADHVAISGYVTFTDLSTAGSTAINGANITTGTISASRLDLSGTLQVGSNISNLTNDSGYQTSSGVTTIIGNTVTTGYVNALGITAESLSADAVLTNGINLKGLLYLYNGTYGYLGANTSKNGAVIASPNLNNFCIATDAAAKISYGDTHNIFVYSTGCYSSSQIQIGSDRRIKDNINYDVDRYDLFFDILKPCSFVYKNDVERTHIGLIAQDVIQAIADASLDGENLAVIGHLIEDDIYSVAYGEIISLCIDQIQKLKARVNALEGTA